MLCGVTIFLIILALALFIPASYMMGIVHGGVGKKEGLDAAGTAPAQAAPAPAQPAQPAPINRDCCRLKMMEEGLPSPIFRVFFT